MTGIAILGFLFFMILSIWAQSRVKSTFNKYSNVRPSSGMTGAQAAEYMLRNAGLADVRIERSGGFLTDHYDPRNKVIRLSPGVHDQASLSAVGVACHEAGHAIQDAQRYAPLVIRNMAVPIAGFGSNMGLYILIAGILFNFFQLALLGVILFGATVVFQVINLPVEFDATARAKRAMVDYGMVQAGPEEDGVAKVLNAAALTYVAATLAAIFTFLYYLMLVLGRR